MDKEGTEWMRQTGAVLPALRSMRLTGAVLPALRSMRLTGAVLPAPPSKSTKPKSSESESRF
jgi:hypothetical protein